MRSVLAALPYFLLVFAAGFALGPVRVLLLEPRIGPFAAVLVEAPVMVLAMIAAARWTTQRFTVPPAAPRLLMGACAFGLLMIAEMSGAVWLRGLSLAAYAAHLTTPAGIVSLALFLLFALMPWLCGPRR
ncbi:MAG: hypothetical protein AB7F35_27550 [Acetobacteraceae bacterium]